MIPGTRGLWEAQGRAGDWRVEGSFGEGPGTGDREGGVV